MRSPRGPPARAATRRPETADAAPHPRGVHRRVNERPAFRPDLRSHRRLDRGKHGRQLAQHWSSARSNRSFGDGPTDRHPEHRLGDRKHRLESQTTNYRREFPSFIGARTASLFRARPTIFLSRLELVFDGFQVHFGESRLLHHEPQAFNDVRNQGSPRTLGTAPHGDHHRVHDKQTDTCLNLGHAAHLPSQVSKLVRRAVAIVAPRNVGEGLSTGAEVYACTEIVRVEDRQIRS